VQKLYGGNRAIATFTSKGHDLFNAAWNALPRQVLETAAGIRWWRRSDPLDEAEVEHAGAKDLIAQIKAASPADHLLDGNASPFRPLNALRPRRPPTQEQTMANNANQNPNQGGQQGGQDQQNQSPNKQPGQGGDKDKQNQDDQRNKQGQR